jgi:hypothetical protein
VVGKLRFAVASTADLTIDYDQVPGACTHIVAMMRWLTCYCLILAIGMGASRADAVQVPGCEFASFVEVTTMTALPADVLSAIGKMADRDQPFNATDYIKVGLRSQRFVVAGSALVVCS